MTTVIEHYFMLVDKGMEYVSGSQILFTEGQIFCTAIHGGPNLTRLDSPGGPSFRASRAICGPRATFWEPLEYVITIDNVAIVY